MIMLNIQVPCFSQSTNQMNIGRLYGKIIDSLSGKPVEASSIQIIRYQVDTFTRKRKEVVIAGMLTKLNGDFAVSDLPVSGSMKLRVTAIGFVMFERPVSFDMGAASQSSAAGFIQIMNSVNKDIGNIRLQRDIKILKEVQVQGSSSAFQMNIDRKVFNADKLITSQGGMAIDVLKNIPFISVNSDGTIELRHASPQIFVDGKPTLLMLQQIPANSIEKIELITNPSAKFDATGTGGIINIILKKKQQFGSSGFMMAGFGWYSRADLVTDFSFRKNKFNWRLSAGGNNIGNETKGHTFRENYFSNSSSPFFNTESRYTYYGRVLYANIGLDYYMDNRNTFSVLFSPGGGRFSFSDNQEQQFLNKRRSVESTGIRNSNGSNNFSYSTAQFSYTHNYIKPGHELTADITYNHSHGGGSDLLVTNIKNISSGLEQIYQQKNETGSETGMLTMQTDIINPLNDRLKLEAGIRTNRQWNTTPFNSLFRNQQNEWIKNKAVSNSFHYLQVINAVYISFTGRNKKASVNYQAGLRLEQSVFTGRQNSSKNNSDIGILIKINGPDSGKHFWQIFFPSLFITKEIRKGEQIQFTCSRRIQRPSIFQLLPYAEFSDIQNIRQGNASIKPEFTYLFEMTYNKIFDRGNFLTTLYCRNTVDAITRFLVPFSRYSGTVLPPEAGIDSNTVLVTTYLNALLNTVGSEFSFRYKLHKNVNATLSSTISYLHLTGMYSGIQQSNNGWNWLAKLNTTFQPPVFTLQLSASYEAPKLILQGRNVAVWFADISIRKPVLKNKTGFISFTVNDIFNQRASGNTTTTALWKQEYYRRWEARNFRLSVGWNFGKLDVENLKRKNRKAEKELRQAGQNVQQRDN
jgi:hypothetical protein